MDKSLPATAASAHSGFSKGTLGLYLIIIGTSICDQKYSLTIKAQVVAMALSDNRAQMTQG